MAMLWFDRYKCEACKHFDTDGVDGNHPKCSRQDPWVERHRAVGVFDLCPYGFEPGVPSCYPVHRERNKERAKEIMVALGIKVDSQMMGTDAETAACEYPKAESGHVVDEARATSDLIGKLDAQNERLTDENEKLRQVLRRSHFTTLCVREVLDRIIADLDDSFVIALDQTIDGTSEMMRELGMLVDQ